MWPVFPVRPRSPCATGDSNVRPSFPRTQPSRGPPAWKLPPLVSARSPRLRIHAGFFKGAARRLWVKGHRGDERPVWRSGAASPEDSRERSLCGCLLGWRQREPSARAMARVPDQGPPRGTWRRARARAERPVGPVAGPAERRLPDPRTRRPEGPLRRRRSRLGPGSQRPPGQGPARLLGLPPRSSLPGEGGSCERSRPRGCGPGFLCFSLLAAAREEGRARDLNFLGLC